MQSRSRKIKRIMDGLQNHVPSSTKISKYTKYESAGYPGYRTNRGGR